MSFYESRSMPLENLIPSNIQQICYTFFSFEMKKKFVILKQQNDLFSIELQLVYMHSIQN